MSENDKKDFEFIKEQVIEKKRKKLRKKLIPFLMTISLAILFGLIAAVTFVLTEPRLYELLHKEEPIKTPVAFPTEYPEETVDEVPVKEPDETQSLDSNTPSETEDEVEKEPETIIVEQPIKADIEDFSTMYDELRKVSFEVNKSLVTVVSITDETDVWFGTPVELAKETTGLIVHNNSVELLVLVSLDRIQEADTIQVKFSDSTSIDAVIQDYESELNLAIIAVPLKDIPATYMNNLQVANLGESYTLLVGSPVIALGNPNGHTGSMEIGIISNKSTTTYITDNKIDLFNTDIADNENSDGVIINIRGEVIGLITRTLKADTDQNISTAIGISKLKTILANMINKEPRIYFGVKTVDMPDAAKLEYVIANGIYVNDVIEDSPAFLAGIQIGDIILQINEQTIINTSNFYNAISLYMPEEAVKVKIKRTTGTTQGEMDITVTLAEKEK